MGSNSGATIFFVFLDHLFNLLPLQFPYLKNENNQFKGFTNEHEMIKPT